MTNRNDHLDPNLQSLAARLDALAQADAPSEAARARLERGLSLASLQEPAPIRIESHLPVAGARTTGSIARSWRLAAAIALAAGVLAVWASRSRTASAPLTSGIAQQDSQQDTPRAPVPARVLASESDKALWAEWLAADVSAESVTLLASNDPQMEIAETADDASHEQTLQEPTWLDVDFSGRSGMLGGSIGLGGEGL